MKMPFVKAVLALLVTLEVFLLVLLFTPAFVDRRSKARAVFEASRDPTDQTAIAIESEHRLDRREKNTTMVLILTLLAVNSTAMVFAIKQVLRTHDRDPSTSSG